MDSLHSKRCVGEFISLRQGCRFDPHLERYKRLSYRRGSAGRWHFLYSLLLSQREQHYNPRERRHNYQLTDHASALKDKNVLIKMLYKDLGCSHCC